MRIENILKIAIPAIAFGACATGGASTARDSEPQVSVGDPVDPSAPRKILAAVETAQLPDADQAYREIRDQAGDEASATVELCVAPDGHVDRVELKRRSASTIYDRAVVKDVADWQFGGQNWTPPKRDSCELATIKYDPQP